MLEKLRALGNSLFSSPVMGLIALVTLVGLFRPDLFYEKRPDLVVETTTNTDLLSVRAPLAKLKVSFGDRELNSSTQTIRLVTFRVRNAGNDAIKIGDFDPKVPLGVLVRGGELIEIPAVSTSNAYQKAIELITSRTPHGMTFGPMILDQGDFFTVGILVLANSGAPVTIEPTGKIAGITTIRQVDQTLPQDQNLSTKVFSGGWQVQVGRLVSYFFLAILSAVAFAVFTALPFDIGANIKANRTRANRKLHVNRFIQKEKLQFDAAYDLVFQLYANQAMKGNNRYDAVRYAITHDKDLAALYTEYKRERPLHPASDEPLGWEEERWPTRLALFAGSALTDIFEGQGDIQESIERFRAAFLAFDAYLKSEGIPLQMRAENPLIDVSGAFFSGDKYRKEVFEWL